MTGPANETVSSGIRAGRLWACDNGAFGDGFNERIFFHFLLRHIRYLARCLFVAVPDVYANAPATLDRFRWYAWRIKALGFPVAYVAQDGAECYPLPRSDWLFIGGSTDWKLSPAARRCILQAKRAGRRVHVGRVNSLYRIGLFEAFMVDSVDGTYPKHNPREAARRFTRPLKYPMPRAVALSYRAVLDGDRGGEPADNDAGA
jgi:hypothetical protein